jgi:hypothetical protein
MKLDRFLRRRFVRKFVLFSSVYGSVHTAVVEIVSRTTQIYSRLPIWPNSDSQIICSIHKHDNDFALHLSPGGRHCCSTFNTSSTSCPPIESKHQIKSGLFTVGGADAQVCKHTQDTIADIVTHAK